MHVIVADRGHYGGHRVARLLQVCAAALAVMLAACGSETPTGPNVSPGPGEAPTTSAVAVSCTTAPTGHTCRATAQLSDGSSQDITNASAWTSSNTNVATVDAAGRVTHVGSGQAEIRATYQDRFGGAIVLVNVTVTSVTVTCAAESGAHVCTAIAQLSNTVTQDVTRSGAVWSSSNPSVATVDSTGRVTHLSNGQVQIAARFQSVTGGIILTLSGIRSVTSVTVTCAAEPEAHQCAAVAQFSDATSETVTSQTAWVSSNTAVATVDSSGRVRHRSSGQVEIRATYRNVTGSIVLNIVVGSGTSVVINEFALRSQWGQFDDYVELRNDGPAAVDISGWHIREWIASSGSIEVKATVGSGVVLAPGCHYLAATLNATLGGIARDTNLSDLRGDGGLALVRADGGIVDQVGMNPNSPFREGTTLRPTTADDSPAYTRAGNDTNDNASDFLTRGTRTPMNSASSCAVR